jgi:hypothetical protein
MRNFIIALLAMSVPAVAAPAHRHSTPETVQVSGDHSNSLDAAPTYKDLMNQSVRDQSFKTIEFDPKVTKAIGAICRGC